MAQSTTAWTLEQLERLPDDGNRYELVNGELFVTPAPSYRHGDLVSALAAILFPHVAAQRIGTVRFPRDVVRVDGSQVEPDLMVRPFAATTPLTYTEAPVPLLVIEVVSRTTRQRDYVHKRAFYRQCGIAEYWIVDGNERTIRVVQPDGADVDLADTLRWMPAGASESLVIDVAGYFRSVLGA